MSNFKKRFVALVGVFCIVFMVSSTSFASHSFYLTISPPYPGCLESTWYEKVTSSSTAFVNPAVSQTPTNYFLSPTRFSSTQATALISNVSTSGTRYFDYYSDYGGFGTHLCLSAHPSNWDFDQYTTRGTWSP